jgi:hypothetical protein
MLEMKREEDEDVISQKSAHPPSLDWRWNSYVSRD